MTKRTIDFDPVTGIRTVFDYDHAADQVLISYDDPLDYTGKVLDWNKKRKANIQKTVNQEKREFIHYAKVPAMAQLDMYLKHKTEFWNPEHKSRVYKHLASTEYQDCRITEKKILLK